MRLGRGSLKWLGRRDEPAIRERLRNWSNGRLLLKQWVYILGFLLVNGNAVHGSTVRRRSRRRRSRRRRCWVHAENRKPSADPVESCVGPTLGEESFKTSNGYHFVIVAPKTFVARGCLEGKGM
jgi:hypothetical protein